MSWQAESTLYLSSVLEIRKGDYLNFPGKSFFVVGVHPRISAVSVRESK